METKKVSPGGMFYNAYWYWPLGMGYTFSPLREPKRRLGVGVVKKRGERDVMNQESNHFCIKFVSADCRGRVPLAQAYPAYRRT